MVKYILNIQNNVLNAFDIKGFFTDSFQKEFEFMVEKNFSEKHLSAKKRQIENLKSLTQILHDIYKATEMLNDCHFKFEALAVYHGVSFGEIIRFMSFSKKDIEIMIKESFDQRYITVPENIRPLIDENKSESAWLKNLERDLNKVEPRGLSVYNDSPKKEIKYAEKLTIPFDDLKRMAENSRFKKV